MPKTQSKMLITRNWLKFLTPNLVLKDVMKVSILAMHLSLKTDHEYTLVLICANKSNVTLLNDICLELTITLNKQIKSTNKIEAHVIDACLTVKSSLLPQHTIQIMLTSSVFYSENFLKLDAS
ncbi:unnamed protein product [Rotaria sp. Silwood1]|nr:unnamed protein product [Rotaria sp. Silwood1]CAF4720804.1 unnamed protein product [Rotaria sp. Silwood1]